jgi:hypothetical protein
VVRADRGQGPVIVTGSLAVILPVHEYGVGWTRVTSFLFGTRPEPAPVRPWTGRPTLAMTARHQRGLNTRLSGRRQDSHRATASAIGC